jgi:poly(A) polymerase
VLLYAPSYLTQVANCRGFSTATDEGQATIPTPTIIPRSGHVISRANISKNALRVLYRLKEAGFAAYMVGGGVRDLLLGREPKDFDVATDAHPDQVRQLFRNCRLIGRRFRLAHVHFGPEVIEVATFRALSAEEDDADRETVEGRIVRDNVYGTFEDDAFRRDFTINALYYDIRDFSVVDFSSGLEDLRAGVIRLIGDPEVRLREDPVRMLRAVRFAAKLGFRIDPEVETRLPPLGPLLANIPASRLYEEVLKLFHGGFGVQAYELLRHYDLFRYLFPATDQYLAEEEGGFPRILIVRALENTDARITAGKPVTPAFLFAALLWERVRRVDAAYREAGETPVRAFQLASDGALAEQGRAVAVPRRFSGVSQEIWALQSRLIQTRGRRPLKLLEHPRFRAGYDFLVLRAEAGEDVQDLAQWWTRFQEADEAERESLLRAEGRGTRRRTRPRRGRGRGRRDAESETATGVE